MRAYAPRAQVLALVGEHALAIQRFDRGYMDDAESEVLKVIAVVDGWQAHFNQCGVTDADIASLAAHIDGDALLSQRRGFKAADWRVAGRKVRHHPFR